MSVILSGVGQAHIGRLVLQFAQSTPRPQGLRELLQNCVEAGSTLVDIIPWTEGKVQKLGFMDDGVGMTAERLTQISDLAYSGEEGKNVDNKGLGAKIANLGWNREIVYVSLRSGKTHKMTLRFNAEEGTTYQVEQLPNSFWTTSQIKNLPSVKSAIKRGQGTLVILNGSKEEPDTFSSWATPTSADREVPKWNASRTLPEYLNNKYLKIGDDTCKVTYWWGLPKDGEEGDRPSKRLIKGLENSINGLKKLGEVRVWEVQLQDCLFKVYYGDHFEDSDGTVRGLNSAAQHNGVFGARSSPGGNGGLVVVALNNEAYGDIKTNGKASTFLKAMGIWVPKLHQNMIVIVRPNPAKCKPNQTRTGLDWYGGGFPSALPLDQMQEEFRLHMPDELQSLLAEANSIQDSPDMRDELREYAKELKSFQPSYELAPGNGEDGEGEDGGTGGGWRGGGGDGPVDPNPTPGPNPGPREIHTGGKGSKKRVLVDAIPNVVVEFDPDAAYQWGDYSANAGRHVIRINPKCQEIQRLQLEQVQRRPRLNEESVRQIANERICYAIATKVLETLMVLPKGANPMEKIDDFFIGGLLRGADMKEGIYSFVSQRLARKGAALKKNAA